jgi:hypothetical protein
VTDPAAYRICSKSESFEAFISAKAMGWRPAYVGR